MPPVATSETSTSEPLPDFQQAFQAARAEHSDASEQASAEEASTETAAADTPPALDSQAEPAPVATATTTTTDLISESDLKTLQAKHVKDPAGFVREVNKIFTQKTQALAADRKTFERVQPFVEVIDAYRDDPEATIAALAEEHGLMLVPKGTAETTQATTTEAAQATGDQIVDAFRDKLGPDLAYLADGLAPAIKDLVDTLTKTSVAEATAPLKAQQETLLTKAATEATDGIMKAFGERHPDWTTHEAAMSALAAKIQPNGMTEAAYLDHLYATVTRDAWEQSKEQQIAEAVKKAVAKIQKGAESTETRTASTPDTQVTKGPPAGRAATFQEAAAAAMRGEKWD